MNSGGSSSKNSGHNHNQQPNSAYMQGYYGNQMAGNISQPSGNMLGGLGVQIQTNDPRAQQYLLQQQYAMAAFQQQQQQVDL